MRASCACMVGEIEHTPDIEEHGVDILEHHARSLARITHGTGRVLRGHRHRQQSEQTGEDRDDSLVR